MLILAQAADMTGALAAYKLALAEERIAELKGRLEEMRQERDRARAGEGLSQEACRRTLPIFDGHQRYDLKLAFKRMDKMTAEKGYAGAVVVCSVSYEPIAGHRANIPLVKYLSEGREMEIALAPIAGTRLLAPFRLSVVSTLANLMIEAIRFEAIMAPAPAGTPANAAHPSDIPPTRRDDVDERCVKVGGGVVVCQKVPK